MHETETTTLETNTHVELYGVDRVRQLIKGWPALSAVEKSRKLREIEPDSRGSTHNVTTQTLTQYNADDLNPEQSPTNLEATHLALGSDDTAPERSNETLNNEILRLSATDVIGESEGFDVVVFLDSATANGEHILEGGLVDDTENALLNHTLWSDPEGRLDPKTETTVANLIVELRWGDAG